MYGTLISSKRGGQLLVDPHNYVYCKVNITSRVNWKCIEFRRFNCKTRAVTGVGPEDSLRIYNVSSDHNHSSNIAKVDFLRAESTAIQTAVENVAMPPRVILGDVTNKLSRNGQSLPKSGNAFIQTLQRARVKAGGHPEVPRTFDEVIPMIPEAMKMTGAGDRFLRFADRVDPNLEPTMLMFMSPFGRELLNSSSKFFADGTFKTCPPPFAQVSNIA